MSGQGICAECGREKNLPYGHPIDETKGKVCDACYHRLRNARKVEERGIGKRRRKHPGNEILEQLVRECWGNLSLMRKVLFEKKGIEVAYNTLSRWLSKDTALWKLVTEMRKGRHLDEAEIGEMIRKCGADVTAIQQTLFKEKKINVSQSTVWRWISEKEALKKIFAETKTEALANKAQPIIIPSPEPEVDALKKAEEIKPKATPDTEGMTPQDVKIEEKTEEQIIQAMIEGKHRKLTSEQLRASLIEIFRRCGIVTPELLRQQDRIAYLSLAAIIRMSETFNSIDEFLGKATEELCRQRAVEIQKQAKLGGVPVR